MGAEIARSSEGGVIRRVKRFVEKPNLPTAERYVASGDYAWNAGMFVWRVGAFLAEMDKQVPQLAAFVREFPAGDPKAYLAARFSELPKISVDYAVMEEASEVETILAEYDWDDVGMWTSLPSHLPAGRFGEFAAGQRCQRECTKQHCHQQWPRDRARRSEGLGSGGNGRRRARLSSGCRAGY